MQIIVGLFFLTVYLAYSAVAGIPAFVIAYFMPVSRPWLRYVLTISVFALLVTPTLGNATIAVAPAPFALYVIAAILSLDASGMLWALQTWPLWHAIAFPVTLLVALLVFRRLRPNNSFKPKPLRSGNGVAG